MKESQGLIFDIYKGTTHDGPGMRDTIFFKGCSLKCEWCQNPESIERKNRIWYNGRKCIGCGKCLENCPQSAIVSQETGITIHEKLCTLCGICTEQCPSGALNRIAKGYTVEALLEEIIKDKPYFDISGGGVTLSGGEPLLQGEFVLRFLKKCRETGITAALDTCGMASTEVFLSILPYVDIILYDLKIFDSRRHQKYTGCDNNIILEHAIMAADYVHENHGHELWIRTPIIPDATDSDENILQLAEFIRTKLTDSVARWELCLFNRAPAFKYESLGWKWHYESKPAISEEKKQHLLFLAEKSGVKEIIASGITA